MLLKRHYDTPEGWEPKRNQAGILVNAPKLSHVEVIHTGVHEEQNFSQRLVSAAVTEGWMTMSRGKIILHTPDEDLEYTILRGPGVYCCHCAASLGEDASGAVGREHVRTLHPGEESPGSQNPAGYENTTAYHCVLDSEQHEKWRSPEGATVSHWRKPVA